jgi:hypothetical protein
MPEGRWELTIEFQEIQKNYLQACRLVRKRFSANLVEWVWNRNFVCPGVELSDLPFVFGTGRVRLPAKKGNSFVRAAPE